MPLLPQVLVRALLLLSEVEGLRWQPLRGIKLAQEALEAAAGGADAVSAMHGSSDEVDRLALGAQLWLQCRLQVGHDSGSREHGPAQQCMSGELVKPVSTC